MPRWVEGEPKQCKNGKVYRDLLQERRMTGLSLWATSYSVSTAGLDVHRVRQYIRDQDKLAWGQGALDLK